MCITAFAWGSIMTLLVPEPYAFIFAVSGGMLIGWNWDKIWTD